MTKKSPPKTFKDLFEMIRGNAGDFLSTGICMMCDKTVPDGRLLCDGHIQEIAQDKGLPPTEDAILESVTNAISGSLGNLGQM